MINNKTSRVIILAAIVLTVAVFIMGLTSGRKLNTVREQLATNLETVEPLYPMAFDSVQLATTEGRQLKQLNDTVTLYLTLYRQQLDIAQGRQHEPEDVAASDRGAWRGQQLCRLSSLQQSTISLANYLCAQGRKAGATEYDALTADAKKLAHDKAKEKRQAEQSFHNEDYLNPDASYFEFLQRVADMMRARLAAMK